MALIVRKRIEDYIVSKYKSLEHRLVYPSNISDDLEISDHFVMHILIQMSKEGLLDMEVEISDENILNSYTCNGFSEEGFGLSEPFDFEPKMYTVYFTISKTWNKQIDSIC